MTGGAAALVLWATAGAVGIVPAWFVGAWGAARAGSQTGAMPLWLLFAGAGCAGLLAGHAAFAVLAMSALAAAVIDMRCGLIPDALTLSALALLIVVRHDVLGDVSTGALACSVLLALPWALTRGRGFGFGDVKFGLVIGAALGPLAGVCAVGAAFICGGALGAVLLCARRASRGTALPFAPFLAAGAALVAVTIRYA